MCKSSVVKVDGCVLIVYVCCDDCGRRELFENAGMGDQFDEDVVARTRFSCRFCETDVKYSIVVPELEQLRSDIEQMRKQIDEITVRDCSCVHRIEELRCSVVSLEQKLDNVDSEWPKLGNVGKVSTENGCSSQSEIEEDKFKQVGSRKSQKMGKDELKKQSESRYFEHSKTVSTQQIEKVSDSQTETEAGEVRTENKKSFAEKCKNRQGECVVISDSMLRGVKDKLVRDSDIFSGISTGGARIEDLENRILSSEISVSGKNVVLCVGTHNLSSDGTEVMLRKYRQIFETLRVKNCKSVSVVGIFHRGNIGYYLQCKRMSINLRLAELCREFGFSYMCPRSLAHEMGKTVGRTATDIETRILNGSRLHFNNWGQDRIARVIFKHCIRNLNL